MAEQVKEVVLEFEGWTYYDVLAVLCQKIYSLKSEEKKSLYQQATANFAQCVEKAIERFPFLSMNSKNIVQCYSDISAESIQSLFALADSQEMDALEVILGVINCVDTLLALEPNFKMFIQGKNCPIILDSDDEGDVSQKFYCFKALNQSTKDEYGFLLPKMYCEWEKDTDRTLGAVSLDPLSLCLGNYFWARNDKQWEIENLYSDLKMVGLNKALVEDFSEVKIVSSPLSNRAPFDVLFEESKKLFYLKYIAEDDENLTQRIKSVIDYAVEEKADIVIFPEMIGTPACIKFCIEYISGCMSIFKPKLFLLPTIEREENGVWSNTLYVLDENGDCIFKYHKQHPFVYDREIISKGDKIVEKYYEPITPDDIAYIVHVPGIGRIGVIICADVFEDDYLDRLLKDFKITLLLYPVFSNGNDLMERTLSMANKYSCDVLLCNTCAAWDKIELPWEQREDNNTFTPTFINKYYASGHKETLAVENSQLAGVRCVKTECRGCLFVTKISKKYRSSVHMSEQIRLEEIESDGNS